MVAVPVLTPGRYLKRTEPPDVLAGIYTFRKSRFEMQKAVHEALHMKAVEHSKGAEPEKAGPAEYEIAEAK